MTLAAALALVVGGGVVRLLRHDARFPRRRLAVAAALLALGAAAGVGVRAVNGGVVPATADARRTAGHGTVDASGDPVPEVAARRLRVLGDVVAWPAPLPLADELGLPAGLVLLGVGLVALPRRRAASRQAATVEVSSGRLWCEAPTAGGQPMEVALPQGRLRSEKGRFGVVVGPGGSAVVVVEGSVVLVADGRGRGGVVVGTGEGVAVRADGTVGTPRRLPPDELADDPWVAARMEARLPVVVPDEPLWSRPPSAVATASVLVAAVLVALTYVGQVATVPSGSMEPTLQPGDRVVVAKAGATPRAGDVVAFERPPDAPGDDLLLVKRVVAEGGQTVEVRDGRVRVDGEALSEDYLPAGAETTEICGPRGVVEVPIGSLYVLGDARGESTDSRCFGPVPTSAVVGSVVGRTWPPGGI
ncbi:MAG TPA: signal peptidase I [Iamia sp.]|nr:signal peptidase I [Iamia sp.]